MFEYTKDVPPEWQADLDKLAPGENVSRLVLHWLAGLPNAPVQRWAIWEVLPLSQITTILEEERVILGEKQSLIKSIWDALHGTDPRQLGHWETRQGVKQWRTKSLVSREQWDIHRETGGLPMLCWIVEGPRGGHTWQFGAFESNFLMALGTDPDTINALRDAWPTPGSQPYAIYDRRVFEALAERDLLRSWREALPWDQRSHRKLAGLITEREDEVRNERMGERMLKWLDNQIGDAVSDIPRRLLPQWSDFAPESPEDVRLRVGNQSYPIGRTTGG